MYVYVCMYIHTYNRLIDRLGLMAVSNCVIVTQHELVLGVGERQTHVTAYHTPPYHPRRKPPQDVWALSQLRVYNVSIIYIMVQRIYQLRVYNVSSCACTMYLSSTTGTSCDSSSYVR